MSRKSPFPRNQPYKRQVSPLNSRYQQTQYHDKYPSQTDYRSRQPSTYVKGRNQLDEISYKMTQKKNQPNYDSQGLMQKNKALSKQNAELYVMLKERGKIVTALQQKLEEHMARQVQTLQIIEQEKNKFIRDSQRKFKQYECKIQDLIKENYMLKDEIDQQHLIKAHQIDLIKDTLTRQQLVKMQEMTNRNLSNREQTDYQYRKAQHLLKMKNHQLQQVRMECDSALQKMKNQIIELNNQLVHMAHLKKIQISEQRVMYQNMIGKLNRQNDKSKELIIIEYDVLLKKLQKQLTNKEIEASKLGELKKIENIEANARQIELEEKRDQLQNQIKELEQFYRQKAHNDVSRLQQLNKAELNSLSTGNQALISNLKNEIEKLVNLNKAKSTELDRLHEQIATQRKQNMDSINHLENVNEQLKQKMRIQQKQSSQQMQNLKIKWAQLSQADMQALKNFYDRQIQTLQHQLLEKTKLADGNRQKLHQQLQDKNEMRKRFDLQTLKLNTRISQLQLQVNELLLKKRQESLALNEVVGMTNQELLRQTTNKEKGNQSNEEQKRKLQQLINAKDREIEELNAKIKLMRDNYSREVAQKNAQIEIVKKHNEDLENEMRKQKGFYDGQLKKKDIVIKSQKQFHDEEINIQKTKFKKQYDDTVKQMSSQINKLEVEVNRLKAVEKNLKNQIAALKQKQQVFVDDRKQQQQFIMARHNTEKKEIESKLKKYYTEQIKKLQDEVDELKKQLHYKEDDLREMAERHHQLEQKMEAVIESQDKLSNIEKRILNLGQDNNLIKNMAQVVKHQRQ